MTDERTDLATDIERLIVAFGRHSDPRDRRLLAEAIASRARREPPDPPLRDLLETVDGLLTLRAHGRPIDGALDDLGEDFAAYKAECCDLSLALAAVDAQAKEAPGG